MLSACFLKGCKNALVLVATQDTAMRREFSPHRQLCMKAKEMASINLLPNAKSERLTEVGVS